MPTTPKTRSNNVPSDSREKLESTAYTCAKLGKQLLFTISFKEISDEVAEKDRPAVQAILQKLISDPAKYVPLVLNANNVNCWTKVLDDDIEPEPAMTIEGFE